MGKVKKHKQKSVSPCETAKTIPLVPKKPDIPLNQDTIARSKFKDSRRWNLSNRASCLDVSSRLYITIHCISNIVLGFVLLPMGITMFYDKIDWFMTYINKWSYMKDTPKEDIDIIRTIMVKEMSHINNAFEIKKLGVLLVSFSLVILVTAYVGFYGILTSKRGYFYSCTVLTTIAMLIVCILLYTSYGVDPSKMVSRVRYILPYMNEKSTFPTKESYMKAIDIIQSTYECCGYYGPSDFYRDASNPKYHEILPESCCKKSGYNNKTQSEELKRHLNLCRHHADRMHVINEGCYDKMRKLAKFLKFGSRFWIIIIIFQILFLICCVIIIAVETISQAIIRDYDSESEDNKLKISSPSSLAFEIDKYHNYCKNSMEKSTDDHHNGDDNEYSMELTDDEVTKGHQDIPKPADIAVPDVPLFKPTTVKVTDTAGNSAQEVTSEHLKRSKLSKDAKEAISRGGKAAVMSYKGQGSRYLVDLVNAKRKLSKKGKQGKAVAGTTSTNYDFTNYDNDAQDEVIKSDIEADYYV